MYSKEDKILEGQILDKWRECEEGYYLCHTSFLDLHEQSVAQMIVNRESKKRNAKALFLGGYEEAMRRILVFLPDYISESDVEVLTVLDVEVLDKTRNYKHSDYLGAFLGSGLKRELIGDILVKEQGAEIILLKDSLPMIEKAFSSVGRSSILLREKKIKNFDWQREERERQRGTLASLRLDNVIAMAYQTSRSQAQEWIQRGIVYLNYIEREKNEIPVEAGDIIVVRGQGKIKVEEIGDRNRKDKIVVYYIKY